MGAKVASDVVAEIKRTRFNADVAEDEVRGVLAEEVSKILRRVSKPLTIRAELKPHVILVAGVNGSGKTTTIGKLAQKYREEGLKVMMAAGDTFRAAAIEQLKVWGERTGAPVIAKDIGTDAAGLAFEAFEKARAQGIDVLLIDTAGRLQNKAGLMAELEKIVRVLKKLDPNAPHSALLVLDATTGQNAVAQAEVFRETARITGLVMTKLDGTARGGILVSIAEKFDLPVHYVGVGESADDLQPFDADSFARALVGLAA
jgi:fused signal recognition particle receptor